VRGGARRAACALLAALLAGGCGSHGGLRGTTTEEQLAAARADLQREKWSRAVESYTTLCAITEGTLRYPEAKFGLGRAYAGLRDYPAAERELNVVIREHPESEWADDALYAIAETYAEQMRPSQLDQTATWQAVEKVRDFLRRFPESELVPQARALLSRVRGHLAKKDYENGALYLKLGDGLAARTHFEAILRDYADTSWARPAQFGVGEALRKEERFDEAIAAYRAVVDAAPDDELGRKSRERIRALEARGGGAS
jgi:outer membrane protein assembly factor BamD